MKLMVNLLMIMICLFGYISIILGTIYVLKISLKELFGIEILEKKKK